MRRGQLADAFVNRKRRGDVIERKILAQRVVIQIRLDGRMGKQDFRFGGEQQCVIEHAPVERFFAEPIARDEQTPPSIVPKRERKHPVETLDHLGPVFLVKMRHDFGV